jgi:hypothetical protein
MDSGVGAPSARHGNIGAQDRGKRRFEFALHRAQARLTGPPVKPGAVIGKVNSQPHLAILALGAPAVTTH